MYFVFVGICVISSMNKSLQQLSIIPIVYQLNQLSGSMNFPDSSFMHSSSNSFRNLDGQTTPRNRDFIKYLYTNQSKANTPYREEMHPHSSPLIKRHHSHDAVNPKPILQRYVEPTNTFHNRFCDSIIHPSNRDNYHLDNYQKEMADLSARDIILTTQNELLKKEIRRLKDEIQYLNEKNQTLQKNNQQLLAYKSRAEILDRQYNKLLNQVKANGYQSSNKTYQQNYGTSFLPFTLQNQVQRMGEDSRKEERKISQFQSKFLKGKQVSSRIIANEYGREDRSSKISWKRVTGTSPIYKIDPAKKKPLPSPYDELPLIESKIDSSEHSKNMMSSYSPSNELQGRQHARTIDLKEFQRSKSKEFQKKCLSLQQQLIDIRKKNIELYKKCEEFQGEKLGFIESLTQLKYEKAKQLTDLKNIQKDYERQINALELQQESNKIAMMELNQQIASNAEQIKLLKLQKQQLQVQLRIYQQKCLDLQKDKEALSTGPIKQVDSKYQINQQLELARRELVQINKINNQLQIEKKVLEHQLNEKKQSIIDLQNKIQKQKQSNDPISKVVDQLDQESKLSNELGLKEKELVIKQQQLNQIMQELSILRESYSKLIQDKATLQQEVKMLRDENLLFGQNCKKLTKIFQHEKQQNIRLNELRQSWREIERRMKEMKRIDLSVDHLWQIKEVEYDNINTILKYIKDESKEKQDSPQK